MQFCFLSSHPQTGHNLFSLTPHSPFSLLATPLPLYGFSSSFPPFRNCSSSQYGPSSSSSSFPCRKFPPFLFRNYTVSPIAVTLHSPFSLSPTFSSLYFLSFPPAHLHGDGCCSGGVGGFFLLPSIL